MSWKTYLLALLCLALGACASESIKSVDSAEGAFREGERLEKNERYDEALAQFNSVRNKHPYSSFAIESKLRIADIHFKRENFIEAENAYKLFKEFHPKHEKIDYVTYQLGMSYFKQLPSTIDRDLSLADNAILYFDEVINSYPDSPYAAKAKEHRRKSLQMLAEKEFYIADFYFIRKKYDSALGRFEALLKKYPNLGLDARALYGAAYSSYQVKDLNKARLYYSQIASKHPDSKEKRRLEKEIGDEL